MTNEDISVNIPPWLSVALLDLGLREIDKNGNLSPKIREMFASTRFPPNLVTKTTPWCSAAICYWMEKAGIASTRSASASSWATWGDPCMAKPGSVVVFGKADPDAGGTGHVALFERWNDDKSAMYVLGGNQHNSVCVAERPASRVVAVRWPHLP